MGDKRIEVTLREGDCLREGVVGHWRCSWAISK